MVQGLVLLIHCRKDSRGCGVLVYEIVQIVTYGAALNVSELSEYFFTPVQSPLN